MSNSGFCRLGDICTGCRFVRSAWVAYPTRVERIRRIVRAFSWFRPKLRTALALAAILEAGVLVTPGCSSSQTGYCPPGVNCCANNADCSQSCYADGCNLTCAQTGHSCNSACGNQCVSTCHDTNDCSLTCANNCSLDCYSTASCAGDCGASCNYTCTNTSRCNVRVAATSTVTCDHVATCTIQCTGACTVNFNSVDACSVTCPTGAVQSGHGSGTITC